MGPLDQFIFEKICKVNLVQISLKRKVIYGVTYLLIIINVRRTVKGVCIPLRGNSVWKLRITSKRLGK